jgi:hypothetical protein
MRAPARTGCKRVVRRPASFPFLTLPDPRACVPAGGLDCSVLQWRHLAERARGSGAADVLHARAAPRAVLSDPDEEAERQAAERERERRAGEALESVRWLKQDQLAGPRAFEPPPPPYCCPYPCPYCTLTRRAPRQVQARQVAH